MSATAEQVTIDRGELLDLETDIGALSFYAMKYLHMEWDAPLVTRIENAQARLQVAIGLARREEDGLVVAIDEAANDDRIHSESARAREWIEHDFNRLIRGGVDTDQGGE